MVLVCCLKFNIIYKELLILQADKFFYSLIFFNRVASQEEARSAYKSSHLKMNKSDRNDKKKMEKTLEDGELVESRKLLIEYLCTYILIKFNNNEKYFLF